MVDLLAEEPTPHQPPTLTELEEARAGVQVARHHALEWPEEPDEDLDEEPELGPTPRQEPKLSDLEATLAGARDTRQARIEWLMAPEAPEMQSLLDLFERPAWQREALCRGEGPALFVRAPKADYGRLRAVCGACPVRTECLEFALADDSLQGLWGGTTDAERRERRELRQRVA